VLLLATVAGGIGWWFGSGPGSLVAVPAVSGMSYDDAAAALTAEGFVPQREEEFSVDVDAGVAIRSEPGEGERLEKGVTVAVVVSAGPASHDLGPLAGADAASVREQLTAANLDITDDEEYFDDLDEGKVLNVRITPRDGGDAFGCDQGCTVHEKDTATIQVSVGPVPDVSGMTVDQATKTLTDKGLVVSAERIQNFSEDVAKDKVLGYADRAEEGPWRPGDTIQLIVSKGPELFEVPDVKGMTRDKAKDALSKAGFRWTYTSDTLIPDGAWDLLDDKNTKVRAYTPSDPQRKGATITLEMGLND
jgi:serine/threonine-protein kinase